MPVESYAEKQYSYHDGTTLGSVSPANGAFGITPSDTNDLLRTVRGIYVGGGGTLRVTMRNGDVINFTGLLPGNVYPFSVTRVWSTGTSATSLVGLS